MSKILNSNTWLLLLLVVIMGYTLNFISLDVVMNDNVYQKYLNKKYEKKYNEYKDLDVDLSEFKDELAAFDQQSADVDTSYDWDYFYIDTLVVLVPLLVVAFGYSCLLLLFFLFHKTLNIVKYLDILKVTILSYILFYIPKMLSNIYFLIFKTDYTFENVRKFNRYFDTTTYFKKEFYPPWLWTAISDFDLIYIFFPALVALVECLPLM
ncbi:hypothetical protein [Lutibacter sp.]|uniref:hypothetical protein n=1 Tax=Lutibacter sp. TaxID=1925666 RepID=UPI0025C437CA|nr:hypothetical protein [Lutibacter sp.]MCF6182004.1 hypothetical protein [Lutibacter sp.]